MAATATRPITPIGHAHAHTAPAGPSRLAFGQPHIHIHIPQHVTTTHAGVPYPPHPPPVIPSPSVSRPHSPSTPRPTFRHQPTDMPPLGHRRNSSRQLGSAAPMARTNSGGAYHQPHASSSSALAPRASLALDRASIDNGRGPFSPTAPSPRASVAYDNSYSNDYDHEKAPYPPYQDSFPPSWAHSVSSSSEFHSPRTLLTLVLRAAKDRLSCGSRSGALGRGLIIGWILTTLGFVAAAAFWKGQLFSALGQLSDTLYDMGYEGLFVYAVLIFITTIPPLPLYSTLIVLSGYTFGVWHGFIASYIASLVGAVVVFVVSRTLLRDAVSRSLASSPTATSLLQIIPQHPHLLLLIRIAPYPYNLLNVVLASAPSLSLTTYTACTALSLCKLVLHTWIGAGIHDISAAYGATSPEHREPTEGDLHRERVKAYVTWGGILLCAALFVYLTHLARGAIRRAEEAQRGPASEEEVAFLSPMGIADH